MQNPTIAAYQEEIDEVRLAIKAVKAEMADGALRLEVLQEKLSDLIIGQKVMQKLDETPGNPVRLSPSRLDGADSKSKPFRSKKPANAPPTRTMILLALKSEKETRGIGMSAGEISRYIAEKWWPGCKPENINAFAWRMQKQGEIIRDRGRYTLSSEESLRS